MVFLILSDLERTITNKPSLNLPGVTLGETGAYVGKARGETHPPRDCLWGVCHNIGTTAPSAQEPIVE
jgi:hypothetical protein